MSKPIGDVMVVRCCECGHPVLATRGTPKACASLHKLRAERDEALARAERHAAAHLAAMSGRRLAAQMLIAAIGAPGPETIRETAARAVEAIGGLRERAECAEAELAAMRGERAPEGWTHNVGLDIWHYGPIEDWIRTKASWWAPDKGFRWYAGGAPPRFADRLTGPGGAFEQAEQALPQLRDDKPDT